MKTGGIGASLSAVIHESLFNDLDHEVGENIQPASRLASQRAGSQPASQPLGRHQARHSWHAQRFKRSTVPKQLAQRRQWELRSSSHCSACAACSPGRREDSTARHLQLWRSTLLAPAADNSWPPSLLPACLPAGCAAVLSGCAHLLRLRAGGGHHCAAREGGGGCAQDVRRSWPGVCVSAARASAPLGFASRPLCCFPDCHLPFLPC